MTIQTVGTIGFGAHTTWVSYLTRTPDGKWVHTTLWDLPAHTRVNVTDLQYDTGSPLRNQYFGLVRGTVGGTMILNGHVVSLINSNAGFGLAHTFTASNLGISVPLYGVNPNSNKIAGQLRARPITSIMWSSSPLSPRGLANTPGSASSPAGWLPLRHWWPDADTRLYDGFFKGRRLMSPGGTK